MQGIVVDDNLVIPTPECITIQPNPEHEHSLSPNSQYHKTYTTEFKQPRQFIHVQPFGPNQVIYFTVGMKCHGLLITGSAGL